MAEFRRCRESFLLAVVSALVLTAGPAGAQCAGDCSADMLSQPKAIERLAKKTWKALLVCGKKGRPACPATCPLPDGTAPPYSLTASCAQLVACNLEALAATAFEASWDPTGLCPVERASDCGNARMKGAGKLVVKKLKRRRTSKMDKLAKDRQKCVAKVDGKGPCGGAAVCEAPGAWIDAIMPVVLGKGGYQLLPFTAAASGEGIVRLTLAAESADWSIAGRESVVLDYDVDGTPVGQIVVHNGESPTDYRVMLGAVTAGAHTIGLRHNKRISPASDSAVFVEETPLVEVVSPGDPGYDALRYAPMLLGLDAKLNPFPGHPGNAVSDVPAVTYVAASPAVGKTTYRYVMIWSNEDGGTGRYPEVMLAHYGRTTDIENYVEVDVADTGDLLEVRYRPDESGTLAVFGGAFFGTHPIVRTATANGLVADDGDSLLRFALAPFEFDDSASIRERGMDLDPVSYVLMAKEVIREHKTEPDGDPNSKKISDERNYLFVEYDIDVDVSGNVLRAYAVVGGQRYRSDHNRPGLPVLPMRVGGGRGQTAIELPPGTTLADITEFGMEGVGTMSGTLYHLDGFMLGGDFLPDGHVTFDGALAASGSNPTWSVTLP
ncbi:MAG: hypothetical protein D6815_06530 [Candidatus Dadabacteria bacterium]|nr:MAG: hypothetical protein D6815_06530 [Candidatus Dadabacteria bacterium]